MNIENIKPADIEKRSMEIIEGEMGDVSHLSKEEKLVLKRVIHTTADFDYVRNLKFSKDAIESARKALFDKPVIVTDTNMAYSGINKKTLEMFGGEAHCFMADEEVANIASQNGTTRAVASVDKAAGMFADRNVIYAVGNAPTALIRIAELINEGKFKPALVIGVPVGFVNVLYSKENIMKCDVNYIVADGRKGGSNVAAAIVNALMYQNKERN